MNETNNVTSVSANNLGLSVELTYEFMQVTTQFMMSYLNIKKGTDSQLNAVYQSIHAFNTKLSQAKQGFSSQAA